jgi:hypothetical protein
MKELKMMPDGAFTDKMKFIAEEKDYGRGSDHIQGVVRYSSDIYEGLVKAHLIEENNRDFELLIAACYLHDVGVNVSDGELGVEILPKDDHNLKSFKWFNVRLDRDDCKGLFTDSEKAIVKYCTLWHKGNAWQIKPELKIDWNALLKARLLAAILRVGDALSSGFGKHVPALSPQSISLCVADKTLSIEITPREAGEITDTDLKKANEKNKDLLEAVMKAMAFKKIDQVQILIAKGKD